MADYPYIHDKKAHSWPEVYVAYALDHYQIPYLFQYEIGNPQLRGTIIVDFVLVRPRYLPVEIMSEYWHRPSARPEDRMRLAIIARYFKTQVHTIQANLVDTPEKARDYVKANFL